METKCVRIFLVIMLVVTILSCSFFPSTLAARTVFKTQSPVKEGSGDQMTTTISKTLAKLTTVSKRLLGDYDPPTYKTDPYYPGSPP